jgi:peptidyl-prolyl cis-trans isomerase SurA
MISKHFLSSFVVALAAVLGATAAQAQTREASSSGVLLDRVAATVNEGVVLQSELEEQMFIIASRMREQKVDLPAQNVLQRQVLDRLVLQELQMQRANRAGIKVPDETLNNALADVAKQNGIQLTELPNALEAQGIEYSGYRE